MSGWLLCAVLGLPSWVGDTAAKPKPAPLALTGEGAPEEVVHLKPRRKMTLQLTGPASVEITVIGLREKRGARLLPPGKAMLKLGRAKPITAQPSSTTTTFAMAKRPRWVLTEPVIVRLEVPAGRQRLVISAHPSARLGLGVGFRVVPPPSPEEPPPTVEPPPAPPEPPPAPTPEEPALPDDEPEMITTPVNVPEPDVLAAAGFVVPTPPSQLTLRGPFGEESFYHVELEAGLSLDSVGPGVLRFDIHALRDDNRPESLKPVIIGVMVDEVLLQTLAVDRPVDPAYQVLGQPLGAAERVTLRMPIEAGAHQVRLTLSDTAVLGTAIRPAFVDATEVGEPGLLNAEVARATDLTAAVLPEVYGSVALGVGAGIILPASGQEIGWLTQLDADFAVPIAGPRFSLGLTAGYGELTDLHRFADPRVAAGRSRVNLRLTQVPLFFEARWSVPLPRPFGIELGLGGGAVLVWGSLRARQATIDQPLSVAPAGVAQLTFMLELGPGALVVRGSHTLTRPTTTAVVRAYDFGGTFAGLGYRFIFGQDR